MLFSLAYFLFCFTLLCFAEVGVAAAVEDAAAAVVAAAEVAAVVDDDSQAKSGEINSGYCWPTVCSVEHMN
jgi:hypothetical protein